MKQKQVDKTHYSFDKYINKPRWVSMWHQIDEVLNLRPNKVLEIGPGSGIFKFVLNNNGVIVETVDIDPELQPDYIASATQLPFVDNLYDCVCAFQVLEHLPYDEAIMAFKEMVRVSKHYVLISLPNAQYLWNYSFYIPKYGQLTFQIPKPTLSSVVHKFDGEHYWELNKKGYSLNKIINDLAMANINLIRSYRVNENPYHHFFIFKK